MRAPEFVFLTDDGENPRFGWRLLAANRRPLGRGVAASESLADCRATAERVRRDGRDADVSVVTADGRWSWRLSTGGTPIAVSVRPYLRRAECLRGLTQFRAALVRADPHAGSVRDYGAHALRDYAGAAACDAPTGRPDGAAS